MSAATVTHGKTVIRFDAKPKASLVDVTPAQAKKWLEQNGKNRNVRQRVVDGYARDMSSGNWQVTGDAIKFAFDGALLDGQHRLHAIVQAETTVPMFVIRGLSGGAQEVMDSGVKRTAGDALHLRDYTNTNLLAGAARIGITVETDGYSGIMSKNRSITTSEVAAFVEDHPELASYTAHAQTCARQMDASPTAVTYAMWRLHAIDADAANTFFADCRDGVGLTAGDPVLALRRRFAEARRHRETLSLAANLSLIFRAWNARRDGKALHRMPVISRQGGELQIPDPA